MKTENHREATVNRKPRTKPKVVKEWGEDDTFKLISLVEGEKCLWDTGEAAYNNKIFRGRAWRNIAEHLNFKYSTTDLNAKWTNLRIQYRSYVGRSKIKSGHGEIKAPKWRFYNAMSFVGRSEQQQTKLNNCKKLKNIFKNVSDVESDSNSLDDITATPPLLTQWEDPIPLLNQQSGNSDLTITEIARTMRELITSIKENSKNSFDPNTTFSNYLLSELKILNKEAAAAVRKKVTVFFLQCLEEERIKRINGLDLP